MFSAILTQIFSYCIIYKKIIHPNYLFVRNLNIISTKQTFIKNQTANLYKSIHIKALKIRITIIKKK